MTIKYENDISKCTLMAVAQKMVVAARTAPKAKGQDTFSFVIIDGDDIIKIANRLLEMGKEFDIPTFIRDSESVMACSVLVLMGSSIKSLNLKRCGMCGFKNCAEKNQHPDIPCAFNTGDLGVALGSALSVAMDNRVDNRIMFTVAQAALDLGYLGSDIKIAYAIPLSSSNKNIFFDRVNHK